jgi:DNA-binding SARP family transcriptional activator
VDEDFRHAAIVGEPPCRYLGATLARARIQLCGRVTAEIDGRRVEQGLPGRQGRLLFVYLVANRLRPASRDELVEALWPDGRDGGLSPLLSKLRRIVELEGRGDLRVVLPNDAWIDLEAATEGLHRAESAAAGEDWTAVWGPARVAQHVARRGFLPGEGAHWIAETRRRLEGIHVRSLELVAEACVRIGGPELDTAERAARELAGLEPFRESGQRALMRVLDARGNRAEALKVYEQLRTLLRNELGTAPSRATQELHRRLLA